LLFCPLWGTTDWQTATLKDSLLYVPLWWTTDGQIVCSLVVNNRRANNTLKDDL
jgi:hypothetical protein